MNASAGDSVHHLRGTALVGRNRDELELVSRAGIYAKVTGGDGGDSGIQVSDIRDAI